METGDLLLLATLIIIGLLGLAYVVFVLGNRGPKQYLLSCPPCAVGASSTTTAPVSATQPPPPGITSEPAGAISTMPAVPAVPAVPSTPQVNGNVAAPLTPLAPSIPPIATNGTLLFRNRANGRYLSACDGCSKSAKLVVMAHETNPKASYVQWIPTASGNGWMLSNKFSTASGVLQPLPDSTIFTLKQNDQGVASTVSFVPADSQGYFMLVGGQAIQACYPKEQTPKCACPQFKSSAQLGVSGSPQSVTVPADPRQIWDIYVTQLDGSVIPLLQTSPSQRFLSRRR